ncbi:hypothetical protein BO70DRAFT_80769 [Aspergillus heteromorphus CBS 117.55]|uniref:Secreted protein n=1 Tax=Aspergillus heteromorphus CBS 117.55 TaxID=1448321 RepID=A0A317WY83_9EURO|nr:uncharacterized protein BO70DRAFT_80769 [Aspergillus heteromorphus CBS 117.55]PWY90881.1 hypothetical protein BO70DRAFT_80769 [Aspergillus heteromorphus CBS 117.55]
MVGCPILCLLILFSLSILPTHRLVYRLSARSIFYLSTDSACCPVASIRTIIPIPQSSSRRPFPPQEWGLPSETRGEDWYPSGSDLFLLPPPPPPHQLSCVTAPHLAVVEDRLRLSLLHPHRISIHPPYPI